MKLEITITNGFLEYLKDFETADSAYLAAQDALFDSLDADDNQWNALKSVRDSAYSNRDDCAVVLSRFLVSVKGWISFEADAPADAPADVPADASADAPADAPADASEDIFPVMSAKCKLCPSCVDGRCFFVPDIYDSVFPCQSPAWNNFFKNGGSHGPAP